MTLDSDEITFRGRLTAGELLVGSFIKTPAPQSIEIAALSSLDFALVDAEHAPFSARDIDLAMLAGRAAGIDVLVRIPAAEPRWVQRSLDLGAAGVVIPHVSTVATADAIVRAARFGGGGRGYSNSPRAGGYGTVGMAQHLRDSDRRAAVILQIETPDAVEAVEDIAKVPGVDALFIGRADLAVAYGEHNTQGSKVGEAARRIARVARAHGLAVASFHADASSGRSSRSEGTTMVVLGSDQSMLRTAWTAAAEEARDHPSDDRR